MTVPYTSEVATSTFGCFVKLLFRWRGSIYKLIWKDFITYIILHYVVRFVYRYGLSEKNQRSFESFSKYADSYVSVIPLSFVLGFYVQQIVSRWHLQFETIPFPDSTAVLVTANVKGLDERGRLIRRTMIRYLMLGYVMTMRSISPSVKKRFPTMKHLTEAGLMSPQEEKILDNIKVNFNKYSIPFIWATSLVSLARKEGRIYDDYAVAVLNDMFNTVRQRLNRLFLFDWVGIPLVYTQVVTLSVYLYFVLTLFSQQFLLKRDGIAGKDVDLIIPVAAVLQFFFFMGWLKVAETLINPFGEDDDDFEINAYIDRNMQLAYLVVDGVHADHPPLVKDMYWGTQQFELPYTEATLDLRRKSVMQDLVEAGSAAGVTVPESKSGFILDITQRTGRRSTDGGLRNATSEQEVTPEKEETNEKSKSAHSLTQPEKVEKREIPAKLSDSENLVGILKNPSRLERDVPIPLRKSETLPMLNTLDTEPFHRAADELELRSADSNESIDDDVEKSLKVFDRPLPPSAVRRQRQNSFYEHIDKVHRSRVIEVEQRPQDPMPEVTPGISRASVAIGTIRRILAGKDEDKANETNANKK